MNLNPEYLRWKLGIHLTNLVYAAIAVCMAVVVLTITGPLREWLQAWIHLWLWGSLPPGG